MCKMVKAKTKFMKIFNLCTEEMKRELCLNWWEDSPYSLNIIALEIKMNTKRGKRFLKQMGQKDD